MQVWHNKHSCGILSLFVDYDIGQPMALIAVQWGVCPNSLIGAHLETIVVGVEDLLRSVLILSVA